MRGVSKWSVLLAVFLALLSASASASLVVTPAEANLSAYSASQEVVFTFYNDGFEPLRVDLTPTFDSLYLSPYVSVSQEEFLLEPLAQQNVQVMTRFPKDFSPQTHRFVLQASPSAEKSASIVFRPPGTQRPSLILNSFAIQQARESLLMNITLRNTGNVYVWVTPQVFFRNGSEVVRELSYPRPVVVSPGESYPLVLRQEVGDLEPGEYLAVIKATYEVDGRGFETEEEVHAFVLEEPVVEEEQSSWHVFAAVAASVLIIVLVFLWFRSNGKEKHLMPVPDNIAGLRKETVRLRKEVVELTKQTRKVVEESQKVLRRNHGG